MQSFIQTVYYSLDAGLNDKIFHKECSVCARYLLELKSKRKRWGHTCCTRQRRFRHPCFCSSNLAESPTWVSRSLFTEHPSSCYAHWMVSSGIGTRRGGSAILRVKARGPQDLILWPGVQGSGCWWLKNFYQKWTNILFLIPYSNGRCAGFIKIDVELYSMAGKNVEKI